ncbi:TRAP transporter large permease [Chloroflexota bacterium]
MSLGAIMVVLTVILFALLILGLEIAASLALVTMIGLLAFTNQPLFSIAGQYWSMTNSFILTAIPLFIFMGELFSRSGISRRLFWAIDRWIGWMPGGIACTVIGACAVFAAITGSSVAGAATMGTISVGAMRERSYDMKLTFGSIAAGGTLGILIPPSIIMIVYGASEGLSIGRLFAAGVVPGIMLAGAFILLIVVRAILNPKIAPDPQRYSWADRLRSLPELLPSVVIIVVVLGGVFGGVMTPTEAAAVGCTATLLLALLYRSLNWDALVKSLTGAVRTTSMVLLVAVAAKALAFLMMYLGISDMLRDAILGAGLGKYGTLALIAFMYLILGCFFEGISMMLITLPFVMPIIGGLGLSPYWFVVPLVILIEASLITPPVGLNLYVLKGIAPDRDVLEVARGSLPFLVAMMVVIAIVIVFPSIPMWFPNLIYN